MRRQAHYQDHVKPYLVQLFGSIHREILPVIVRGMIALAREHKPGAASHIRLNNKILHLTDTALRLRHLTPHLEALITHSQSEAARAANDDMPAGGDEETEKDRAAAALLIGRSHDGRKLAVVVDHIPGVMAGALVTRLSALTTQAEQEDPIKESVIGRLTARAVSEAVGAAMEHAFTIARTEITAVYRATQSRLARNRGDLAGWYWETSDAGACPACLAMQGSWHTLDETLDGHPRCRCFQRFVKAREVDDPETGEEEFAGYSEDRQIDILGKRKYALYAAGKIKLIDCVEWNESEQWGRSIGEASAETALVNAIKRRALT